METFFTVYVYLIGREGGSYKFSVREDGVGHFVSEVSSQEECFGGRCRDYYRGKDDSNLKLSVYTDPVLILIPGFPSSFIHFSNPEYTLSSPVWTFWGQYLPSILT